VSVFGSVSTHEPLVHKCRGKDANLLTDEEIKKAVLDAFYAKPEDR
jgi:hypothetical protein